MTSTLKQKWFWYSIGSALALTGFQFSARFASRDIPANMLQFISAFGLLGFGFILLAARRFRIEHKGRATLFGILSGLLLAIGGVALYAALRVGTNAAVVTTVTSLYPMCTVILAVFFLRERLTKKQLLGLALAIVAIVIFSL